jgi:hypothetical protein
MSPDERDAWNQQAQDPETKALIDDLKAKNQQLESEINNSVSTMFSRLQGDMRSAYESELKALEADKPSLWKPENLLYLVAFGPKFLAEKVMGETENYKNRVAAINRQYAQGRVGIGQQGVEAAQRDEAIRIRAMLAQEQEAGRAARHKEDIDVRRESISKRGTREPQPKVSEKVAERYLIGLAEQFKKPDGSYVGLDDPIERDPVTGRQTSILSKFMDWATKNGVPPATIDAIIAKSQG